MTKFLSLFALVLSLTACEKASPEPNAGPVISDFDQEFSLNYQQQARLRTANAPELAVTLAELEYTYCPENVFCFVGTFVAPSLNITDAQGQTQQLTLPLAGNLTNSAAFIDSASVLANSRRYVVYYTKWNIRNVKNYPEKQDISVQLRIVKP
ncbi:hypothetical protein [Hymenobacter sp.]|uniref:hypothetical protein n=1 Tax=Hymenobacter sp. TaxID=1898978 RepID=UPI00286D2B47|nr:hypothetical protein [Hymenobacter sp.]